MVKVAPTAKTSCRKVYQVTLTKYESATYFAYAKVANLDACKAISIMACSFGKILLRKFNLWYKKKTVSVVKMLIFCGHVDNFISKAFAMWSFSIVSEYTVLT